MDGRAQTFAEIPLPAAANGLGGAWHMWKTEWQAMDWGASEVPIVLAHKAHILSVLEE